MKKPELVPYAIKKALLFVLFLVASNVFATTTYTVDLRGASCWSGAHTIAATDSGMTSSKYAVRVWDGSGNRLTKGTDYSASINTSSYDLAITPPSNFCGVIKLTGPFGSSDTSDSGDFSAGSSGYGINVAHQGTYSQRTVNSKTYAADIDGFASMAFTGACQGYVRVYFAASGQLTFMHSVGSSCVSSSSGAVVTGSSYPGGVVQLGTFFINYFGGNTPTVVLQSDDRPW